MDINQNQSPNQHPYPNQTPNQNGNSYSNYNNYSYKGSVIKPANSLAVAAMSLGILALIFTFTFTVYPTLVFGGLAIILALLSKGTDPKMHSNAKTGVIIATVGISFDIVIVTAVLLLIFSPYADPEYRKEFDTMYEQIYGESFEDALQDARNGI